jgi:hypothetical protein
MPEGYCNICGQKVDLVDHDMDPELAQQEEDYFSCADHTRISGEICAGSGHSPRQLVKPDFNDETLTLADLDPADFPTDAWDENWED